MPDDIDRRRRSRPVRYFPRLVGVSTVLGMPDRFIVLSHMVSFVINVMTISVIAYASLGIRRRGDATSYAATGFQIVASVTSGRK